MQYAYYIAPCQFSPVNETALCSTSLVEKLIIRLDIRYSFVVYKKKFELLYSKLALDTLFEKRFTGRFTFGYTDKERDLLNKVYHILHDLKQFDADHKLLAQQYDLPVYEC